MRILKSVIFDVRGIIFNQPGVVCCNPLMWGWNMGDAYLKLNAVDGRGKNPPGGLLYRTFTKKIS